MDLLELANSKKKKRHGIQANSRNAIRMIAIGALHVGEINEMGRNALFPSGSIRRSSIIQFRWLEETVYICGRCRLRIIRNDQRKDFIE